MSKSLKGKVVLITGASSGFGADAAKLFAREGCTVVLAARRVDRLHALADEIQAAGGNALVVPVDMEQQADIELMVTTVFDVYDHVDILFNNAGFGRMDWLENLDPGRDISTQIQVNLVGLIQVTRAVLPSMLKRGSGTIINMSSVSGWIAAPLYSIYAAAKYGVRGFTDVLRREVAPFGIHVCGIYPGPAVTDFGMSAGENVAKRSIKAPSFIYMTSEYVARKTVGLARRPRRTLIIPWWFRPLFWFDYTFPGLIDWFLKVAFVKRFHHI